MRLEGDEREGSEAIEKKMDRNREARRVPMAAAGNGLSRRRHRAGSFRDSPGFYFSDLFISRFLLQIWEKPFDFDGFFVFWGLFQRRKVRWSYRRRRG